MIVLPSSLFVLAMMAPQESVQTRTVRASVMIAAGVADAFTTRQAMNRGAREVNPLMRWPAQSTPRIVVVKTVMNVATAYVIDRWVAPTNRKLAWFVAAGVSLFQFGVAFANSRVH